MQVTTLITLPEKVYTFYRNYALQLDDRTMEQLMSDVLIDFARKMTAPIPEECD